MKVNNLALNLHLQVKLQQVLLEVGDAHPLRQERNADHHCPSHPPDDVLPQFKNQRKHLQVQNAINDDPFNSDLYAQELSRSEERKKVS